MVLIHESDARHGAYDFYAEQLSAPPDLQHLTDENESMAFRRRGYERDALLQAVIDRVGYKDLAGDAHEEQKQQLATLPEELARFDLERYRDRPVQTVLVELLLLPREDERFASCVLIHGMGGTGKTMTAVATLQERPQLQGSFHKLLTGKATNSEDALAKSKQEWLAMLVAALAGKRRALVVLDDPWMKEQVRFLNPIDGSSADHRLLVTTRIRDLVPKATRVELPLMGKDEAVALLLDLAGVEEAEYLKEHPQAAWPPEAAEEIAAECGLLPITLIIAAQVVRSWGSGWEAAVLPLLREEQQQGSGASSTSTVEERVIGAGLQAIERNEDGAAVKELFHMFAATQEDFVHPMAVIEFLWRSCCASGYEKLEGGLASRLKVRQRTQLLLDHSLLLGSSSEGIHLHDIVLQYLRKRLSAEELQAEHLKVVDGMVSAAAERANATGRGLEDTGTSDKVRVAGLKGMAAEYVAKGLQFEAAKALYSLATIGVAFSDNTVLNALKEAHAHLEASGALATREGQQLEWEVLGKYAWYLDLSDPNGDEAVRVTALRNAAGKNPALRQDPVLLWSSHATEMLLDTGLFAFAYNDGRIVSDADIHKHQLFSRATLIPLLKKATNQTVGARQECNHWMKNSLLVTGSAYPQHHHTKHNAQFMHALSTEEWGQDNSGLLKSLTVMSFKRHHLIGA
eukprot:g2365.t1